MQEAADVMCNMKKSILTSLLTIFIYSITCSQDLTISFIKERPDSNPNITDSTIIYPVFKFSSISLSKKINLAVKNNFKQFYEIPDSIEDMQTILREAASQGLVNLNFNLLRNDKRFFSFYFGNVGMGAYSSYWEACYLFDKENGNLLTLDSLISPDKKSSFLKALRQKQKQNILDYKNGELKEFKKEITKEDYEFALSIIKNDCWDNYNPNYFKIYNDKIEIIIDCKFPHVYQNLNPETSLIFKLAGFKQYLKQEYKVL